MSNDVQETPPLHIEYGGMVWRDGSQERVEATIKAINDSGLTDDQKTEAIEALHKQLRYLSDYAGKDCIVHIFPAFMEPFNFSLQFKWEVGKVIYGMLQFNATNDPFKSVTLGPFQWWSIHT